MTLYQRVVALEIGPPGGTLRRIDGLRVSARVKRTSTGTPDPAEITLYNPADATLGALDDPTTVTRVLAGYGRDIQQIAQGQRVRRSLTVVWEGPDRIARWQIQDGGFDLRTAFVTESWAGQVSASTIIEAVLRATSWARGSIQLATDTAYRRGFVAYDSAASILDTVCGDAGSRWSVIDGRLTIWPATGERRTTMEILSADTGLIGAPRKTDKGVEVVSLLRPGMRQGDRFRINHRTFAGDWRAVDVEHAVDTGFAPEFYTTIRAVSA